MVLLWRPLEVKGGGVNNSITIIIIQATPLIIMTTSEGVVITVYYGVLGKMKCFGTQKHTMGTSWRLQWLQLHTSNVGCMGFDPWSGN